LPVKIKAINILLIREIDRIEVNKNI